MGLFNRKTSKQEDQEILNAQKEKVKWSKRPANTAFKQQRLKAWQPILTPATVLPTFFLIGVIFAPLGGVLLWGSNQVKEFTIDYTDCPTSALTNSWSNIPPSKFNYRGFENADVAAPLWLYSSTNVTTGVEAATANRCFLQFNVPQEMGSPVFMYYKLTNYYQNHRRYVKSIDSNQLLGNAVSSSSISGGTCQPVDVLNGKIVYPCGLIANSVFNDTFLIPTMTEDSTGAAVNTTYNMTDRGIAWPGEAKKYGTTKYNPSEIIPPPFWQNRFPDGYSEGNIPDLHTDEHFQVWMRTAGLPTFRKLYFRNDNEPLRAGKYEMSVYMNYPVAPFGGTKSIVFSTVSFIGGKNAFLGIAYLAVGGLCVLLGLVLTARHCIKPRKLGDMTRLSWNQPKK